MLAAHGSNHPKQSYMFCDVTDCLIRQYIGYLFWDHFGVTPSSTPSVNGKRSPFQAEYFSYIFALWTVSQSSRDTELFHNPCCWCIHSFQDLRHHCVNVNTQIISDQWWSCSISVGGQLREEIQSVFVFLSSDLYGTDKAPRPSLDQLTDILSSLLVASQQAWLWSGVQHVRDHDTYPSLFRS